MSLCLLRAARYRDSSQLALNSRVGRFLSVTPDWQSGLLSEVMLRRSLNGAIVVTPCNWRSAPSSWLVATRTWGFRHRIAADGCDDVRVRFAQMCLGGSVMAVEYGRSDRGCAANTFPSGKR
jgi:hypothetical protein